VVSDTLDILDDSLIDNEVLWADDETSALLAALLDG
jgi:hypothetical protein